jgi:hypothetical protein
MFSVLLYRILSVQIEYSVHLNCTDSNYRERQSDCYVDMMNVLLYRMLSIKIVYSVQLNCTDSNYRERESDCYVECVTIQHIE